MAPKWFGMADLDDPSSIAPPLGILQRLKQETRDRHAAIEGQLPLLNPDLTPGAYRDVVGRFYGFYAPMEERLRAFDGWQECGLDYADRYKTPRLAQDLAAMGDGPTMVEGLPLCADLPTLGSASELLGCLYVMEGATLGGQIITRHLQANLGVTPDRGGAFFAGYGSETGSRWKAFCARLNAFALAAETQDNLIASANRTFASLHRWLAAADATAAHQP